MNWESLKLFTTLVKYKNLRDTSKGLNLSHSTIFRRLNDLEEEIGCRLFDRRDGVYELTYEGMELSRLSQPAIESFQSIEKYIVGKDYKPNGNVKITMPTSFAYNVVSKHIKDFQSAFPDIHLELSISNLEIDMNTRDADIAIRIGNNPSNFLVGRQISLISWGVFASQEYILNNKAVKKISDITKHKLIGASGSLAFHPTYKDLNDRFLSSIITKTDDLTMMSLLAKNGVGIAIMPNDLKLPKLVKMCEFREVGPNKLWVLTHPELKNLQRIKIVMNFLINIFQKEII